MLRWIILLTSFSRIIFDYIVENRRIPGVIIALFVFSIMAAIMAVVVSYAPVISLLKLATFTIGVITVVLGFEMMSKEKDYWASFYITIYFVVIILNILIYVLGLGYYRPYMGFQGLFYHPQTLGVFLVPFLALLTGILLRGGRSYILITGLLLGYIQLFATKSRTSVLALGLGLVLVLLFNPYRKAILLLVFGRLERLALLFLILAVALLSPSIQNRLLEFIQKNPETELELSERFEASRGGLISKSIENFQKSPVIGIGFGVASDREALAVDRSSTFGVPLSAPTEKGFLPSAILEETGILGTILFLVLFVLLVKPVIISSYGELAWMMMAAISVNVGEMIFFSFGGPGLFVWLIIGLSRLYGGGSLSNGRVR